MRRATGPVCGHPAPGSNDAERTISATTTIPAPIWIPCDGPHVLRDRGRVPRRVPVVAGGATSPVRHCRRATRPRASPAHREWERLLFDSGWAVVSWPREYGGREASLWEWLIFEEEYTRAGAPQRVTQNGIFLLAPTIFEFGTPEQRDRILAKMASGEEAWCQGWSEPNAGSDLAGIQSRAVRDEAAGGWRLRGQKTWTTRGAFCDRLFGLFRTDPGRAAPPGTHVSARRPARRRRHRAAGRTARR